MDSLSIAQHGRETSHVSCWVSLSLLSLRPPLIGAFSRDVFIEFTSNSYRNQPPMSHFRESTCACNCVTLRFI